MPLPPPAPFGLTHREEQIVLLLVNGYSDPEIAHLLDIAPSTVRTHGKAIRAKLDCRNRLEIAVLWLREVEAPVS